MAQMMGEKGMVTEEKIEGKNQKQKYNAQEDPKREVRYKGEAFFGIIEGEPNSAKAMAEGFSHIAGEKKFFRHEPGRLGVIDLGIIGSHPSGVF